MIGFDNELDFAQHYDVGCEYFDFACREEK